MTLLLLFNTQYPITFPIPSRREGARGWVIEQGTRNKEQGTRNKYIEYPATYYLSKRAP
jgi:hypothetical protein